MQPPNQRPPRLPPRTEASGVVRMPLVPMESGASLDTNGAFVFKIGSAAEGAAFIAQLRGCTNAWFQTNFKLMLDEPLEVMFRTAKEPFEAKQDLIDSAAEWNTLAEHQKASYRMLIDLRTDYGMSMAFDTSYLDKEFKKQPFLSMPGKKFFRQAVIYTKQGNSGMAQGSLPTAWTKGGFGKWAHICPDIGLGMVTEAMKMMESLGLRPGLPNHFPHPIYKPPSGSPLEIHHDQMNPADLVQNLREHVASTDPSMSSWVAKYGIQMLAHLQGGTGIYNGATFIVGPMTPKKMLVCLETFPRVSSEGDYEKWIPRVDNIHFLNVEKYLPAFNYALEQAGLGPIGLVPIAPTNLQAFLGGFGLGFPVGMWHGSFSNASDEDQAVGKGSRVTVTMPLTLRGAAQAADSRIPTRLRAMATVSTEGLSTQQYKDAGEWLAMDLTPYANGGTHKHPERILNFICSPAAAVALGKPVGPYYPISVKPQSVADYLSVLAAIERGESLESSEGPAPVAMEEDLDASDDASDDNSDDNVALADLCTPLNPVNPVNPLNSLNSLNSLTPQILQTTDVRMLKVKQPWAEALVTGQKNVENRTWKLRPSTGFPAWVLVVSSKSVPTAETMKDYVSRLTLQGGPGATGPGPAILAKNDFVRGKIVGMVRIVGCYPQDQMPIRSVWYNPPDIGWVVDEALAFEEPIDLDPSDKFQTQVALRERPQYIPRLLEEVNKLEPNMQCT